MNINTLEPIDKTLDILQKLAILFGICFSAWFFFLKEEGAPHVKLSMEPVFMPGCILRVDIEVENKGGKAWEFESSFVRVFLPTMDRIRTANVKEIVVGTQILNSKQTLRIGETSSIGFNIALDDNTQSQFYVVKAGVTIKEEEGEWVRIVEGVVKENGC
jgi:hypothetical protein